jgi:hypothetical protein
VETLDYRLQSYYDSDGKHLVRGFYLGTKPTSRDWSVSKETIADKVKQAIGTDIIFDPELFNGSDGHVYANTLEELLKKQKAVSRGKITNIHGPFPDEDGHIYYDFEGEITDKLVSEALVAGTLPLSVSPYLWGKVDGKLVDPQDLPSRHNIEDYVPVHVAIVKDGAFGWRAVLSKQCLGHEGQCHNALAASSQQVAEMISSQLLTHTVSPISMSATETQNVSGPVENANTSVPQVNNAPVKSPDTIAKQESTSPVQPQVSVEEFTKLQADLAAQTKINEKLVLRQKTETLGKIFGNVADETERAKLIKKWIGNEDVDILADFHNDILNYVLPKQAKETVKETVEKKATLAGSTKEEDCGCGKNKKKETDFPIAGSSSGTSRLNRPRSLTQMMGGLK